MKTIVMTGGTSGLGKVAAARLARMTDARLLLGARGTSPTDIATLPLDLARLASVRDFAADVAARLGDAPIDLLVLNAGTQFPNISQRTADGFETTFAVNHLAHYLLLRLLLPRLGHEATVVITTSDTHDPRINPLAPRELDAKALAQPSAQRGPRFVAGFRAYSSSKLCNLLTARALAATAAATARNLRVIAYNPGLTPDTSLARAWPLPVRAVVASAGLVGPFLRLATTPLAGNTLADLALGQIIPPAGRIYASLVRRRTTWPDPSALASSDAAMHALWQESARMVELSPELP